MNFSMIYELRDRLETAVIAGVGLIQEDFRLKKAIQQIEPFAKASPVFGKIYQMACKSVEPSCEDRAGVLLDTLALVDAVLCTQGSLQKEGELKPIKEQVSLGNICTNVPYSQMAPVLEAFNGTGSGRYATLRDTYKNQPEIFEDYRVKGLMVKALGDSYSELADMVAEWLEDEGVKVLPLLKQGFNPQGKRDMAKRVQVIEAIAGKDENEFYLEMLPKAGKEVKEALVFALHNDKGNEGQLLDLVKAEKGKVKEAALYSLSYMEGSASLEYWNKQMKKNPQKTVTYLRETKEDWASDLVADSFIQWLDNDETASLLWLPWKDWKPEDKNSFQTLWSGAAGKHSQKICQCYERVYQISPGEAIEMLNHSLVKGLHPNLCQVAEEMYAAHGDKFLHSVFWIDMLTKEPEEVFERFHHYFQSEEEIDETEKPKKKRKTKDPKGIIEVLSYVKYEEKENAYIVYREEWSYLTKYTRITQKLEKGIDLRWYPLLLNSKLRFASSWKKMAANSYDNAYDNIIANLFRPDMESLQHDYGKYFYLGAKHRGTVVRDVRMMKRCGWTDYHGLLACLGKRHTNYITYETKELLKELPLSTEELAEELEQLIKGYGRKAINGIGVLENWCGLLKKGIPVEDL